MTNAHRSPRPASLTTAPSALLRFERSDSGARVADDPWRNCGRVSRCRRGGPGRQEGYADPVRHQSWLRSPVEPTRLQANCSRIKLHHQAEYFGAMRRDAEGPPRTRRYPAGDDCHTPIAPRTGASWPQWIGEDGMAPWGDGGVACVVVGLAPMQPSLGDPDRTVSVCSGLFSQVETFTMSDVDADGQAEAVIEDWAQVSFRPDLVLRPATWTS